jgi:hypothetical protein
MIRKDEYLNLCQRLLTIKYIEPEKTTGPSGVEPETAGFLPLELKVRYSTWLSYGPIR